MDRRAFVTHTLAGAGLLGGVLPGQAQPRAKGTGTATASTRVPTSASPAPQATTASPAQFLSWDAGSGPSRDYWSQKLLLPWAHPGAGDWLDARQQPQGHTPYASTLVHEGPVLLAVTALVQRWLDSGSNRGFYLRSAEPWPYSFAGRLHATPSARPRLQLDLADGSSVVLPCTCNADWTPSSYLARDSRERFLVAAGNQLAVLQFDLGALGTAATAAPIRNATLHLHCLERKYAGRLEVMELNPPTFRIGGGSEPALGGLARGYVWDRGIARHPDVLFAADFSDLSRRLWQTGSAPAASRKLRDARSGSTVLASLIPAGQNQGGDLEHAVVGATPAGAPSRVETELYARYYLLLEDDWGSEVDANKMPGWDARLGWWNSAGYWQSTTGNGGNRPSGLKLRNAAAQRWEYEGASMRGHGGTRSNDGNPYDALFWLGNYIYHLDQDSAYGEPMPWTGVVIDRGRWHCIEQHIRMNSISGPFDAVGNGQALPDGQYTVWMDGVPAFARGGLRWRRHPEMGIQGFWLNWYHGGTAPAPRDMHFRMDAVVIARSYIGPRQEG